MKKRLKISTRIWLSLSILVSGYLFSMALGIFFGQKIESRLYGVSEYLILAANQSQLALISFNEQVKQYNDAIVTGEKTMIKFAGYKAKEVQNALKSIMELKKIPDANKEIIKNILNEFVEFTQFAESGYIDICSLFEEEESKNSAKKREELEKRASNLAKQTSYLKIKLNDLAEAYRNNLKTELDFITEILHKQRYLNMIVFFGVVFCSLILIFIIIRKSIIKPLWKTVEIAKKITAGKNDIEWLDETDDEIGALNYSLKIMTTKLRTAEKQYRGIFENAVEGIFRITPEGLFLNANPSMLKIIGLSIYQESVMSSNLSLIKQMRLTPDSFKQLHAPSGKIIDFETKLDKRDGSFVFISLNSQLVRNRYGEAIYYEGSIMDITERIEKTKAERDKKIAEGVNKKLMDSIRYARTIQASLLPNLDDVKNYLSKSFFIWMPRDIVGGDIFFIDTVICNNEECKDSTGLIIAVMDCTGHGVPGAFMTMIAASGLRKIIKDICCVNPAEILSKLNSFVKTSLQQDRGYSLSDDGLDMSICFIHDLSLKQSNKLVFAGARLPLICSQDADICVISGDKQSIGYKDSDLSFNYTNHTIQIKPNYNFYMSTDGYWDQIGGEKNTGFGRKRFFKFIKEISNYSFEKQKEMLLHVFREHKKNNDRQDDVTVIGFGF